MQERKYIFHLSVNQFSVLFSSLIPFQSWRMRQHKKSLLCWTVSLSGIWSGRRCPDTPGGPAWWPQTPNLIISSSRNKKVRCRHCQQPVFSFTLKRRESYIHFHFPFQFDFIIILLEFILVLFFSAANSRSGLLYHVQYFGDAPERGYIFEKNMVSFTGEDQYHELSQANKQPASRAIHKKVNHCFLCVIWVWCPVVLKSRGSNIIQHFSICSRKSRQLQSQVK